MKTSREQFEVWVKNNMHPSASNEIIRIAWDCWQASRQCIEVESPGLLTTPVKQFEFERDCQWIEAISKAGIKIKGA